MILGDGGLHPGKYNMALIRRAIKGGWGVPEDIKRMVVNQMALVVGRSDKDSDKIAAARVLVAADSVDAKMEIADATKGSVPSVNVAVQVNNGVREAVREPEYLEWLEQRRLAGPGDPGAIRGDGESGSVEADPAPAPDLHVYNADGDDGWGAADSGSPPETRQE